jgi:hypothetical protein
MKKTLLALALIGTFVATSAVQAKDIGVTAEIGSTGIGAHLVVPVQDRLNARFGINAFNYDTSTGTNSTHYDLKLRMQTADALLDYYPAAGTFRLTGGLVYNNNKFDATAKPAASGTAYTFNGVTYSAASTGSVNGTIDFRNVAPYLGIGWGNAVARDKGWGFTADAGVLFQGSPSTSLFNSGCTAGADVCSRLATDLAAETASLNGKAHDYRFFPVLRVGATYRF